jgi:hypothetical protein
MYAVTMFEQLPSFANGIYSVMGAWDPGCRYVLLFSRADETDEL